MGGGEIFRVLFIQYICVKFLKSLCTTCGFNIRFLHSFCFKRDNFLHSHLWRIGIMLGTAIVFALGTLRSRHSGYRHFQDVIVPMLGPGQEYASECSSLSISCIVPVAEEECDIYCGS